MSTASALAETTPAGLAPATVPAVTLPDLASLGPDTPLPEDVPTLHALIRQLLTAMDKLRAQNAELQGKLDAALRHPFGPRSEKRQGQPAPQRPKPGQATRHGRAALPEHLERRDTVHDLTEAEKLCPCCGQPRVCIGQHVTEQLDL